MAVKCLNKNCKNYDICLRCDAQYMTDPRNKNFALVAKTRNEKNCYWFISIFECDDYWKG